MVITKEIQIPVVSQVVNVVDREIQIPVISKVTNIVEKDVAPASVHKVMHSSHHQNFSNEKEQKELVMLKALVDRPLNNFDDHDIGQGLINVLNRNEDGATFFQLWVKFSEFTIRFYNDQ